MSKVLLLILIGISFLEACSPVEKPSSGSRAEQPNILIAISDDQSFAHTSFVGYKAVNTPSFDRIAKEGVYFVNGFAASPGCSPSRAALLTGRHTWQIGAAGTHASHFDTAYTVFPDLLEAAGYAVGFTGKGWGPGNWEISGRKRNPAGPEWQERTMESPEGINNKDYAGNFEEFFQNRDPNQPFYFWYGAHEPHRVFKKGIGKEVGKDQTDVEVPGFLPDHEEIRSDILDYCREIEWFDMHLGRMIQLLEEAGELDNTLIIVTSDNGMAFPRAKANAYEYGIHVPMAMRWGSEVPGNRIIEDLVGFVDLAPTILAAANVQGPGLNPMTGKSLLSILQSDQSGWVDHSRKTVYAARERHSSSRFRSLGYPQRAIRTPQYLLIRNFHPERWPAGAPKKYGAGNYPTDEEVKALELGPEDGGYHDIDACPSLDFLIANKAHKSFSDYLSLAVSKRPAYELFNIQSDPDCLKNLAGDSNYQEELTSLQDQLNTYLFETGDPRMAGEGDKWETYPRYSRLRLFPVPEWAQENPENIPEQLWWEKRWD